MSINSLCIIKYTNNISVKIATKQLGTIHKHAPRYSSNLLSVTPSVARKNLVGKPEKTLPKLIWLFTLPLLPQDLIHVSEVY